MQGFFVLGVKMKLTERNLISFKQTILEMVRLCKAYYSDLGRWIDASFPAFYNYVKKIPYIPDPENIEALSRPKYLLNGQCRWCDCDDKSILIGSWCFANKVPFEFNIMSSRPDRYPHHVYTSVLIPNLLRGNLGFVPADAIYSRMQIGKYMEPPTYIKTMYRFC